MAQIERQELHCHDCGKYIQFDLDLEIDGNHVLECPVCHHQHCRIVQKGKVSDTRWDARNGTDKSKGDKPNPDGCKVLQGDVAPDKPKPEAPPIVANPSPPSQIIGPNGLPVYYVSPNAVQWTNYSTYTIYQGTQGATSGNIYLYQAWMTSTSNSTG